MLKCQSIYFLLLAGEQLFHKSYYTRMRRFLFSLIAGEQLLYKDAKDGHKVHSVKNRILRVLDVQIRPKALEMSPILYNKCQRQKQRGLIYRRPLQFFIFNLHRQYILLSKYILQTAKTVTGRFQSWKLESMSHKMTFWKVGESPFEWKWKSHWQWSIEPFGGESLCVNGAFWSLHVLELWIQ